MSTVIQYPHLTLDDDGAARIERMRYRVIHLAGEHDHYGWSAEEILRQHPDLRLKQVHAALTYFYDHYDRLVEEMRATLRGTAESLASTQPRPCARRSDRPTQLRINRLRCRRTEAPKRNHHRPEDECRTVAQDS
jgi:uncharacterized protein (DUF433 family)